MNVTSYNCKDNLFLGIHASQLDIYGNTNKIYILADETFFINGVRLKISRNIFGVYNVLKIRMFMNLLLKKLLHQSRLIILS